MAMDRAASQSGLEQHKRLAQQKAQAQADAATANGHMPAARNSFGTARPGAGLHGVMSGLTSVREEESTHAESLSVPSQNGTAPAAAQAAPIAAVSGGESGGAQFIVGGAAQSAQQGVEAGQQPAGRPPRAKPVKVPSRNQDYPYGMSKTSSPLPVLLSPFAAAAAGPSTAPVY